jgi:subtilisin-like proprotein convertase family protein
MKINVTKNVYNKFVLKAAMFVLTVMFSFSSSFGQILINESFSTVVPLPAGWAQQNLSTPAGSNPVWFQGNAANFPSFSGAPNAYISANFNSVGGANTISNWLFTPGIAIKNGDQLSFYTRTTSPAAFADRLQVRMSTNGNSVNAGTTNTSVGDFTTLLLDINPTLILTGAGSYPEAWQKFTVTISGLAAPTNGRIAFRYFVTSGGPAGANSDIIGIDDVIYDGTPCTNTPAPAPIISASSLTVCAGTPVTLTANGVLNNSASFKFYSASCGGTAVTSTGNTATVTPAVTTTYFVRGEAGCGTTPNGACGQITINVVGCACFAPGAATICEGSTQRLAYNGPIPTFTSSTGASVTIPSNGNFNPYPGTVTISGMPATNVRVASVQLNGMNHTFANDLDLVLVSPTGQAVILMSDVAGGADILNANFVIRDGATPFPAATPTGGVLASGTYAPTNPDVPDNFPAPGPGSLSQGAPSLASFTGNLNGTWQLFGVDDAFGDAGSIGSWSITFENLPTITWTGANIFTNAAANTPYVAGNSATVVWVKPTATTTYVATVSSGPCAGPNNLVVTVLPRPVVAVSSASGCTPFTTTASGADAYSWSPNAGFTAGTNASSATVTVAPLATTAYNVVGINANGCSSAPVSVVANASPATAVISSLVPGPTFQINEGFETVTATGPAGWAAQNNSVPVGSTGWFQGNAAVFNAFDGPTTSYIGANFNNTTANGLIDNWLFTPTVSIKNGDVISFYTRSAPSFANRAERLQLRMSLNGASTNVNDFTVTLVQVNPNLVGGPNTYPETFTQFTATISGVTGTVPGRFAFRYFVTGGGNPGTNSNFIGIDRVQYGTPATGINCANTVNNIKVDITGGVSPYTLVYSDGVNNTTFPSYTSGASINVAPSTTTTYTIVSVTGANGCSSQSTANTGTAIINVVPAVAITTQPTNRVICGGNNTTFAVVANTTAGTTYQWQQNVVPAPGAPVWTDISNGGIFSGATTATLTVTGATTAVNGTSYRVIVRGACPPLGPVTSSVASLSVNAPASAIVLSTPANITVCEKAGTTISATAVGNALAYQWQVSTDAGTTWTNIANGTNYAGVTTNALNILAIPLSFANNQYRVLVTSGGCTAVPSTAVTIGTVNPAPLVVLNVGPRLSLVPGLTTKLTTAVSPNPGVTYQWFQNGVAVPNATASSYEVNINTLGSYNVRVVDNKGCIANAGVSTPAQITVTDTASTKLWVYPNPSVGGQFEVRYYNDRNNRNATPASLSIYDEKGARVFTQTYAPAPGYNRMVVNMAGAAKGVYHVDLLTTTGERLATGSVIVN